MKRWLPTSALCALLVVGCSHGSRRPEKLKWHKVASGLDSSSTPRYTIVRGEQGAPAPEVKQYLASVLPRYPDVEKAYLVDVDYGTDKGTACLMVLRRGAKYDVVGDIARSSQDTIRPLLGKRHVALDYLPWDGSPIPPEAKPFYVREQR